MGIKVTKLLESVLLAACLKCGLENSLKFTGKHQRRSLFFNEVGGWRPTTLQNRYFVTGAFLRILWNFWEQLFYRTPDASHAILREAPKSHFQFH